jgi:UDP-3-O-[3-hydroxymyristoyl] glucosamine N-acyltransferase
MPHKEWLKSSMTLPKLPEMRKSVIDLEKRVAALEEK